MNAICTISADIREPRTVLSVMISSATLNINQAVYIVLSDEQMSVIASGVTPDVKIKCDLLEI